eukprot:COSAG05_NODE_511_length_9092_cov_6.078839_11_plen_79_part_00
MACTGAGAEEELGKVKAPSERSMRAACCRASCRSAASVCLRGAEQTPHQCDFDDVCAHPQAPTPTHAQRDTDTHTNTP